MITIWTIGAIDTFALCLATGLHNRAASEMALQDATMPMWCIQAAVALACVGLWPVLLLAMIVDEVKT